MASFLEMVRNTEMMDTVSRRRVLNVAFEEAKQKFPVVDEVLRGETTFTQIVTPLANENLRARWPYLNGACTSQTFEENAKTTATRLRNVIDLTGPGACLTAKAEFRWKMFILSPLLIFAFSFLVSFFDLLGVGADPKFGLFMGIFLASLMALMTFLMDKSFDASRHWLAYLVVERAKELDDIIRDNYKA